MTNARAKRSAKATRKRKVTGAKRQPDIAPLRRKRGEQALKLRQQGLSWVEVGRKMKVSGSYARNTAADVVGGTANLPPISD